MKATILACAVATMALGISAPFAGGWPDIPPRKKPVAQMPMQMQMPMHGKMHSTNADMCCSARAQIAADARMERLSPDGFEFTGGEAGWELAQHKYELGQVTVHAADCPVALAREKVRNLTGEAS